MVSNQHLNSHEDEEIFEQFNGNQSSFYSVDALEDAEDIEPHYGKDMLRIYYNDITEHKNGRLKRFTKSPEEAKIEEMLPLVYAIAKKLHKKHPSVELEDLIQSGNLGLIEGVKHYDESRGGKLSTYAGICALRAMFKALRQNMFIKVPQEFFKNQEAISKVIKLIGQEYCRMPSIDEIAELTGISAENVMSILLYQAVIDIDEAVCEYDENDNGLDYAAVIASREKRFDKCYEDQELVNIGLAQLTSKAQDIVLMHFVNGYTFLEIAASHECSLQNIKKICDKALVTMHDEIESALNYGIYPMRA